MIPTDIQVFMRPRHQVFIRQAKFPEHMVANENVVIRKKMHIYDIKLILICLVIHPFKHLDRFLYLVTLNA